MSLQNQRTIIPTFSYVECISTISFIFEECDFSPWWTPSTYLSWDTSLYTLIIEVDNEIVLDGLSPIQAPHVYPRVVCCAIEILAQHSFTRPMMILRYFPNANGFGLSCPFMDYLPLSPIKSSKYNINGLCHPSKKKKK